MTLKDELLNDPLGIGYAAMSDVEAAAAMNVVNRTVSRDTVSGSEIFNGTDDAEYAALTEAQKASWDALCAIDSINTSGGIGKAREAELFGPGTATRTALIALKNSRTVSRAEELGFGTVYFAQITVARG